MDFAFTEEQDMLATTAREFLEKECPKSMVRDMENDEKGYSVELWNKIAKLGWMGLVLPEEYGGGGGEFLDLVILLEEIGRALLPSPFFSTIVLGALPLLEAGTDAQKRNFLPQIAKGELILAMAFQEPQVKYDIKTIKVSAAPDAAGNEYVLNGVKLFVPDAAVADWILCVTKTGGRIGTPEGITLFLVDAASPGIEITPLHTMSGEKQCEVKFNDVRVPSENVLGAVGQGRELLENILEKATVAQCALMSGGAQKVVEMSADYAKERVQFGRPIGVFQAVQHRIADQKISADGARHLLHQAAWFISKGLPAAKEVALAKAANNLAYRTACVESHQTHGAIGVTMNYDLGLYTRRAKVAEFLFGATDFHFDKIAEELLR